MSHIFSLPRVARACLAFSFVFLGACANQAPTQTGFLADYSSLKPTKDHPEDPSYRRPGLDGSRYASFILDAVVYRPAPGALRGLDQSTVAELTADYQEKLRTAFAARFSPAPGPGPGVLRVRAAVTNVERSNAVLNVVTMAATGIPFTAGGASTEAEVVDSETGERLVALQTFNNGGKSFLGGPVGYMSQYGHARRAFAKQAELLCDLLIGPTEKK